MLYQNITFTLDLYTIDILLALVMDSNKSRIPGTSELLIIVSLIAILTIIPLLPSYNINDDGNNIVMAEQHQEKMTTMTTQHNLENPSSTPDKSINLSNNIGFSSWPSVFSNGNNTIYVGWEDNSTGNYELLFTKSTDGGTTFSDPINLSSNNGTSEDGTITELNGTVYVGLSDNSTGNYEILLAKSADGGTTFTDPINLSNNTVESADPVIKSSKDNVYVVWSEVDDIFFTRSKDGVKFDKPINLSNTNGTSFTPRLAVSGNNNLLVVWEDQTPGYSDVFFSKSTDSGATFSDPINISNSTYDSYSQDIGTQINGDLYVAWNEILPDFSDIFFAKSTDGGITFDKPINLSNSNGSTSYDPTIAVSEDNDLLYIGWSGVDNTNITTTSLLNNSNLDRTTVPWTGITPDYNITAKIATAIGLEEPEGVLIVGILPGSPAQIAGLKGGNDPTIIDGRAVKLDGDVILKANDTTIKGLPEYRRYIMDRQIGDNLILTIFREGKLKEVNITIGSRPADEILLVKSLDGGATFSDPINISNSTVDSSLPKVVLSKDNDWFAVWEDSVSPENSEVFFTKEVVQSVK
jgi:PDZ domain